MNVTRFDWLVNRQCERIKNSLLIKGEEYRAGDVDVFHNFKRAGFRRGITPEKALDGMLLKHEVSIGDIINNLDGVLKEFDDKIGLNFLKAVHCNDSLNILGSHKDRHAGIGKGTIGLDAMSRIINHPALKKLPFYLETPNDLSGYAEEIRLLRKLYVE